jgi:hypothetical protein
LKELHERADDLYLKVDAITDYEKARNQAIETSVLTLPDDVKCLEMPGSQGG